MQTPIDRSALESIENASQEELRALQLERLRWSLHHAYENVGHYRQSFDRAGVQPRDLLGLEDLGRFPFLVKQDFRTHYPLGLLAVPRDRIARLHASSGTTGKPTVVAYTARDIEIWATLVARSIRAAGGRPGDVVQVAYGYGLFTGGLGAHYGAEKLGCAVVPISGGQTERQVQLIEDLRPRIIMVTPSYMLAIAEEYERQGLDPRRSPLEVGIFGAEPWSEEMRTAIESRFDIEAVDIYGLSEVMGPGIAQECADAKGGLCLWEDHFYPEIIDPVTGAPVPDGSPGELVLTSLTKEALPVIRYRTRDLTRLLPPAGRSMRRMARIAGRSDDMLIIRGVNVFPGQLEELILKCAGLTPHYQLELTRRDQLDSMTIHVERTHGTDAKQAQRELQRAVKAYVGITVDVIAHEPGALERSAGKAKRLLDQRPAR